MNWKRYLQKYEVNKVSGKYTKRNQLWTSFTVGSFLYFSTICNNKKWLKYVLCKQVWQITQNVKNNKVMCTVSKDVQSIEKNLPSCYDWLVVKKYRYLKQDKSKNCKDKLLKRSDLKNDAEDSKIWRCDVTIKIIVIWFLNI